MTPELTKNLQSVSARFPEVFEELKNQAYQFPSEEALAQYLHRCYGHQEVEALLRRWVRLAPGDTFHITVTSGFGDGSHLAVLLQTIPQTSRVCVLEADVPLLLSLLQQKDVTALLNDPRLILITPFSYREIINRLNLELIGINSASTFIYTPIFETQPGLYRNMMDTILRQLTIRWNQLKTDITHADAVFANSICNLATHHLGSEIQALQGLFSDRPFVLVGAGPSLDESFEFLREAQGKAVIAVVNSAYRAVVRKGIKPDLTVAVDPNEGTFLGYKGMDTSHPILVSTYLVYPEVPKLFKDRVFPLSSFNFLITTLRRILNLPQEDSIVGDGTVSSTVVNLAALLGCNEIYLVGQDLAVKSDGQLHTSDSFYSDKNSNTIDTSTCRWLPGNHGKPVPVEEKLHAYLRIFENHVSHYAHIRFHNLSREGAKIHGAPYLELPVAIDRMRDLPGHDYHQDLLDRLHAARLPDGVFQAACYFFERYDQYLESLIPVMLSLAVSIELAISAGQDKTIPETAAMSESRARLLGLMHQNPLFTTLLSEGRTKSEYQDFICSGEPWKLITDDSATPAEWLPQLWALIEGALFQKDIILTHLLKKKQQPTPGESNPSKA